MSGYIASKPCFLGPKVRVHSSLYIDEVALCLSGDLAGSPYNEECHLSKFRYYTRSALLRPIVGDPCMEPLHPVYSQALLHP